MYVGVFAFFVLGSGIVFLVFFNFWVCVLGSEFVFLLFLFKTHLDLNSYDF